MKKQSLLEYMKNSLDDILEWWKIIGAFFICVAIVIFITTVFTFLFIFVLCLFISSSTVITLLSTIFFLAVLLGLIPIAWTVFEYFIYM